jgi:glycosyltransferase involved in cell wall biosynthesis
VNVPAVSAYVPCFNNETTVRRAVESLLSQTTPPAELLVVDDGSSDRSMDVLRGLPVRVIRHERNLGRGAVRACAMREVAHDVVACCDATNVLEPDFISRGLRWLEDERVAAVFGRITQPPPRTAAERWRGRHLFKLDAPHAVRHGASLSTFGTLVRASAVRAAGGFDPRLRHTEDGDLGTRLRAGGLDVVYDPRLTVTSIARNSVSDVLERYWRWYAGRDEAVTWRGYWKNVGYSVRGMAAADLRAGDPSSAVISLVSPHYQYWRSRATTR